MPVIASMSKSKRARNGARSAPTKENGSASMITSGCTTTTGSETSGYRSTLARVKDKTPTTITARAIIVMKTG